MGQSESSDHQRGLWPLDLRISAAKDQVSSDLGGEAAILSLTTGIYYGLDAVGNTIWQRLQMSTTVGEVLSGIVAEYDVDGERARMDLDTLLKELARERLIDLAFPERGEDEPSGTR